ncbi:MAG: aldehyde dehydrogenase family protein [Flavobacteriales bacterium]|nr:aldehyde dehydrogenase family protein [Flavobacteriales bacterium]MCB9336208.1 aldehyde dehydrogenase family protein [Flavobacteriales bacterium]
MRLEVLKTYKIYIGGKFPRTESGRYYTPKIKNEGLGNICLSSRKDFRNAVVAARGAFGAWSGATAYNKSQVLYRIAEMLEGRKAQFIAELIQQGSSKSQAEKEVAVSVDRIIYYAGWCDKYTQIFSAVNPVASSHFNFTSPEPTGVVSIITPEDTSLIGLVSSIIPVIVSGNTCVVLASESKPLCAVTFAEVLNSSDVPGGVVNILTGNTKELLSHMASHMDVNAFLYARGIAKEQTEIQKNAVENLKRVVVRDFSDVYSSSHENPYYIEDFVEMKTTWHPIEVIGAAGSGY